MKNVVEQLANYACYHRDGKNIATHFVGIPLIVIAIVALLSRPAFEFAGIDLTPALIVVALAVIYYLFLDLALGIVMGALLYGTLILGSWFASMETVMWLTYGIGLFVVGWVFQFVGHFFEGRKPAFVDDIVGLAIGPLFVVAEALFMLGLRKRLYQDVEHLVAVKLPQMPPIKAKA
ncbi:MULTISPECIES: DUF962 domain-containing protein [Gammaproteobacteria]|uniref:Mpo1 family 2-hydroxy fatty acid dioxygenase n=1 Tax=Gammaproteobacteria TaxID=1236 RepID=UPI000DD0BE3B|nr:MULTISPECIES: Mpo1-like protein [Gammaproteobacteria]RTE86635.1 DUF962 domain-containing protein [Aliidiomarina sp. B3213]TCZ90810.1 DUF962 domain-containing protein [Lysobacter sp. N42]